MMNKCSKIATFLLCIGVVLFAEAGFAQEGKKNGEKDSKPKRISAQVLDLGKVHTVYMVPGMATLIEVPSPVSGIRLGNPDYVSYFRPEHPDNEVTLVLKEGMIKPTNFFILSGKKKYIFDIVPSRTVHQDSIEIVGAYGGAELQDHKAELIDSSDFAGAKK